MQKTKLPIYNSDIRGTCDEQGCIQLFFNGSPHDHTIIFDDGNSPAEIETFIDFLKQKCARKKGSVAPFCSSAFQFEIEIFTGYNGLSGYHVYMFGYNAKADRVLCYLEEFTVSKTDPSSSMVSNGANQISAVPPAVLLELCQDLLLQQQLIREGSLPESVEL